ncbi:MAG: hypothetical protein V4671_04525 [Armatimonadota bacterium]
MTDEEQDLPAFQEYLRSLTPDSLWDVQRHLDADRYPRRTEATSREIARRRLYYLNPYSLLERKLRFLFGCLLLLSVLAAALHGVAGIPIPLLPGEKLPYFYDLAAGGPKAAQMVLPLTRFLASLCFILTLLSIPIAVFEMARRKLRGEVFLTGFGALLLSAMLLLVAYR